MNPAYPKTTDLVVAGAGPAGMAAALTGARRGMKVLLVDPAFEPGGIIAEGLHTELCGLYNGTAIQSVADTMNPGVQREMAKALNRCRPQLSQPLKRGRVTILPFEQRDLRYVLKQWLAAEPNLSTLMRTAVTDVECRNGRIQSIGLSNHERVICGSVADCTGCAVIASLAGACLQTDNKDEEPQLAGLTIKFGQVGGDASMLPIAVPYSLREAVVAGSLPPWAQFTVYTPSPSVNGEGICKLAIPFEMIARLEGKGGGEWGACFLNSLLHELRARLPDAFAPARILARASIPQPRQEARLKGDLTLTENDVLAGRKYGSEQAVRNAWPIEFWHPVEGPQYDYLAPGDWYEIPTGCLRTAAVVNLRCAGRCVSATPRAAASVRAAGACLALGELAVESL